MGRRGPLPDPHRKQGERRDLAPVVQLMAERMPAPVAPKGLLPVTRKRWKVYLASDVALALTTVDVPALERLFFYYDVWERAVRSADDLEFDPDLLARRLGPLEKLIGPLEAKLGCTPSDRARLGIQVGQAKKMTIQSLREGLGHGV